MNPLRDLEARVEVPEPLTPCLGVGRLVVGIPHGRREPVGRTRIGSTFARASLAFVALVKDRIHGAVSAVDVVGVRGAAVEDISGLVPGDGKVPRTITGAPVPALLGALWPLLGYRRRRY